MKSTTVKSKSKNKKTPKLLKLSAAELARVHGGLPPDDPDEGTKD